MDATPYSIDSFEAGDSVVFERVFTRQDFENFRVLSGDSNPLHHDTEYAASTPFEQPIVPLHLTLAPLSMIAGMVFPGEPALYLGHEVRAARSVSFGDVLCYSARIEAVNRSHRVLALRVLVIRGAEVVLDAAMRVQSRFAQWSAPPSLPIRKGSAPAAALVTGATGEIGRAISVALAKRGWHLVLQYRKEGPERIRLSEALAPTGTQITFVQTDLNDPAGRSALAAAAAKIDDLGLIVHAASPAVTAPLDELVAVNFEALKDMVDAALPKMLGRQSAAIVLVGSTAIEHSRPGWEAYAGAKGMAATFINGIEQAYASYGVRGLHLLTGLVATRFSAAFRGTTPALLPQEVAEALLTLIEDRGSPGNTLRLDFSGGVRGRFGFYTDSYRAPRVESAAEIAPTEVVTGRITSPADALLNGSSPVAAVVLKMLHLPANAELGDARLGVTPGWDSLKHIELLVTLESALGIRFASGEMESLHSFSQLDSLCRKKIAEKGSR